MAFKRTGQFPLVVRAEKRACTGFQIIARQPPVINIGSRSIVWPAVILVLAGIGAAMPQAAVASQARHQVAACGPPSDARTLAEPPNVDVWELPLDASGEHELILAAHGDAAAYCYRYVWKGVVQTVAPTLRVRRGERFAVRVVNDISGPSKGERAASSSIPPCMPVAMSPPMVTQHVGYLNHTIDDSYMGVKPVDTNIHLHGFQGPAAEENIFLSTLSTPMHACEYRITIPATQPPGTYFYHPHAHGSAGTEVALGLSGAWIVEPDSSANSRSADHVVMLRYRLPLRLDNRFAPDDGGAVNSDAEKHEAALRNARPVAYDPFNPPPWPVTYPLEAAAA